MRNFSWKGALLVGIGAVLVLWSTQGLVSWPDTLWLVVGIGLMASGASPPARASAKRERAEIHRRLEVLEKGSAHPCA